MQAEKRDHISGMSEIYIYKYGTNTIAPVQDNAVGGGIQET